MSRSLPWAALALSSLFTTACSIKKMTVDTTAEVLKDAAKGFNAEPNPDLARLAGPGLLKTTEGFLQISPNNRTLLVLNAESFCGYGFAFVEDELETLSEEDPRWEPTRKLATSLYERCEAFGRRLLHLYDDDLFPKAMDGSLDDLKKVLTKIEADKDLDAVPGLFWTGLGMGSRINVNRDDITAVPNLPKVIAIMETVAKLDPRYYNGGANLTLGLVYSAQGKAMGGDPDKGKQKLDAADAATEGKFLMIKVMMARIWATQTGDRASFDRLLKEVLDAPENLWPAEQLANTVAKRKAARYQKHAEEWF